MLKTHRKAKLKRTFYGREDTAELIDALNAGAQLPIKLTGMLSRIDAERDPHTRGKLIQDMAEFLKDFQFSPLPFDKKTRVEFEWRPINVFFVEEQGADGTSQPVPGVQIIQGEGDGPHTVRAWLKVQRLGLLSKVKQCATCHTWFHSNFRHMSYCGVACRQKAAETDPERIKERKKYQHDYYVKNWKKEKRS